MRYAEIAGGIQIPVSSEEQDLLTLANAEALDPGALDERKAEVARYMVRRGLLLPVKKGEEERLAPNIDPNIWRI
jgi:hypothetical protein